MQQNYTMLSGFIPGSELNREGPGNAEGDKPVIAILCFTVTTVALLLLPGSAPEHRDALPVSTLNHDSPTLSGRSGFPDTL
jgi:hypothetical protein